MLLKICEYLNANDISKLNIKYVNEECHRYYNINLYTVINFSKNFKKRFKRRELGFATANLHKTLQDNNLRFLLKMSNVIYIKRFDDLGSANLTDILNNIDNDVIELHLNNIQFDIFDLSSYLLNLNKLILENIYFEGFNIKFPNNLKSLKIINSSFNIEQYNVSKMLIKKEKFPENLINLEIINYYFAIVILSLPVKLRKLNIYSHTEMYLCNKLINSKKINLNFKQIQSLNMNTI